MEDGEFIISGQHKQINSISESLSKRFLENGMPIDIIEKLKKKEV
jgi:pilus assembly protein CpaF